MLCMNWIHSQESVKSHKLESLVQCKNSGDMVTRSVQSGALKGEYVYKRMSWKAMDRKLNGVNVSYAPISYNRNVQDCR